MYDMIIRQGTIIDGSGKPRFLGDVAIKKDRIVFVGTLDRRVKAKKEIKAKGLIVSPGVIDIHTHADLSLYRKDGGTILEPLVKQGITTVVGGNCGFGLAPLSRKNRVLQQEYMAVVCNINFDRSTRWETMGQFMSFLEKKGLPMNTALLAPHGVMRLGATGAEVEVMRPDMMRLMKKDLEASLAAGAFGLSTGLQYFPGLLSNTEEVGELAAVLRKYDGVFTCHLRSYTSSTIRRAFDEVYSVIRPHGIRGQISHIFALPWNGIIQKPYLAMVRMLIRHARLSLKLIPESIITMDQRKVLGYYYRGMKEGLRVGMDIMPTATGFTPLLAFFPSWIIQESADVLIKRLADPGVRKELKEDIEKGSPRWPHSGRNDWSLNLFKQLGYGCSHIMGVVSEKNRHMEGQSLYELAKKAGRHPVDFACDLLIEERGHVLTFESIREPDDPFTEVAQYPPLFDPNVSIVTDTLMMGYGRPSYLFHGAFPKFYGYYARDKKRIDLETAVKKCTSLPASQIGIPDRGLVREGCFADMLIFDEATIATPSTFLDPVRDPVGISHVIVNGKIAVKSNRMESDRAGKLLRRGE
ncbi:MAG: amidohydrolase family protein [Spirochaetes bacterium]|nr:amidohydrolase family protein [Spirochaetota bacterium]